MKLLTYVPRSQSRHLFAAAAEKKRNPGYLSGAGGVPEKIRQGKGVPIWRGLGVTQKKKEIQTEPGGTIADHKSSPVAREGGEEPSRKRGAAAGGAM